MKELEFLQVAKQAAGEAGGRVTDLKGQLVGWTSERVEVLATNGLVHVEMLEELNR